MKKIFNRETRELWIGIIVALVALIYLVGTTFIQHTDIVSVGAEFMPKVYGYLLLLVSICQIISGAIQYRSSRSVCKEEIAKEQPEQLERRKHATPKPVLEVLILIAVCVSLMPYIGFVLCSIAMTFGMCIFLTPYYEKRRYLIFLIFSAIIAILTYFLFKNVLYVSLPDGVLFS